jgi:hypothetical protein
MGIVNSFVHLKNLTSDKLAGLTATKQIAKI